MKHHVKTNVVSCFFSVFSDLGLLCLFLLVLLWLSCVSRESAVSRRCSIHAHSRPSTLILHCSRHCFAHWRSLTLIDARSCMQDLLRHAHIMSQSTRNCMRKGDADRAYWFLVWLISLRVYKKQIILKGSLRAQSAKVLARLVTRCWPNGQDDSQDQHPNVAWGQAS